MEYSSAIKKEQDNAICSNMFGNRESEVISRKTDIIWYYLYVESKIWHK